MKFSSSIVVILIEATTFFGFFQTTAAQAQTPVTLPTPTPITNTTIQQGNFAEQRQKELIEAQRQAQQQAQAQRASQLDGTAANKTPTANLTAGANDAGPCFKIKEIQWLQAPNTLLPPRFLVQDTQMLLATLQELNASAAKPIANPEIDSTFVGCLQNADVQTLLKQTSDRLIDKGYITSRVTLPNQNIKSGILSLNWLPGVVADLKSQGGKPIGAIGWLYPRQTGKLYNQRHYDQALENIKRLPSQGDAKIEIQPGQTLGSSDVVYTLPDQPFYKRIHGVIGVDNSGGDATGKTLLNGQITFDSPLFAYDQLSLNFNQNSDINSDQKASKTFGANWDIQSGPMRFGLGYNYSKYLQTSAGYGGNDLKYEGNTSDWFAQMGYMLYRNSSSKLQAQMKLGRKINHNLVNAEEIPIQLKDYVYLDYGLDQTIYRQNQQYNWSFGVRQNILGASKVNGFIYGQPDWNGQWRVYTATAGAMIPFQYRNNSFKWTSNLKAQSAEEPTPNSEMMSLGSRYTVRGFNEDFSISGERGAQLRNELAFLTDGRDHQIYLGLDAGLVRGPTANEAITRSLVGAAWGARGQVKGIVYDFALGIPIKAPDIKDKHHTSFYGSLSYQF